MDLLGDLGGITEVFGYIAMILLFSYPDFNFKIKALSILYLAKTKKIDVLTHHVYIIKKSNEKKKKLKMLITLIPGNSK
jgi:hypothetical protein